MRSTHGLAPQNPARRRPCRGSWAQQRLSPATLGYKTLFPNLAIGRGAAVATHTAVIVIGCCLLFLPVFHREDGHRTVPVGIAPSPTGTPASTGRCSRGAVAATLPLGVLDMILRRPIVPGLSSGAVKG
ncbi:hypothetical protein [Streptomyces sp. N2A]|uniref:hypothetical protein n=1 Tax=Streptomyces sp. N2A TaxID=3073936 RepID=UPI00287063E7|nr:hypothetical protein [Streptomyces sp. N2A]